MKQPLRLRITNAFHGTTRTIYAAAWRIHKDTHDILVWPQEIPATCHMGPDCMCGHLLREPLIGLGWFRFEDILAPDSVDRRVQKNK